MLNCAPVPTLMTYSSRENVDSTSLLGDSEASSFRHIIGRLLYLTNTRPDIMFVVHHLSQFVSSPTNDHRRVALRILRYLKNNPRHGIFISSKGHCQIRAYSDMDWAACPKTRKFIIGFWFTLEILLFHGKQKRKSPSLVVLVKQTTGHWLPLSVRCNGFLTF